MYLEKFKLNGKTAFITGGGQGIGLACAEALAEAGARVVIGDRDSKVADSAKASLKVKGFDAETAIMDVTDTKRVAEVASDLVARHGKVDILVNNAGIAAKKDALDVTFEEWSHVLSVNLDGVWNCSQIFGRGMVARRHGSIINIGSMSGLIVNRPNNQPAYNASKAAVHHLTRSLAAEWAPFGVRVNAIAPGYVKTEMSPVDDPDLRRWWIEDAPMRRYAQVEEFGPAVVFLAGTASSFVTGSVLVMDGGYTLF
jgi:NAD(P)-dependent dehydrogenase (short-subunit alcohol dehydrogenase family)